jgi:hypothetical protein
LRLNWPLNDEGVLKSWYEVFEEFVATAGLAKAASQHDHLTFSGDDQTVFVNNLKWIEPCAVTMWPNNRQLIFATIDPYVTIMDLR